VRLEKRLQALEKRQGTGNVVVFKEDGESDEKEMERYIAKHGEKPHGAAIFFDSLDIKACI